MADARIHHKAHSHPKVIQAGNAAFGLWARMNAWTRDHHTVGKIPRDTALEFGTDEEIKALVAARLWDEIPDGYQMHDYPTWNQDLDTEDMAGLLVSMSPAAEHPAKVRNSLRNEVQTLLNEGQEPSVIEQALKKWASREDAPPAFLHHFVSDAIRQGGDGFDEILRKAWRTGDVSQLAQFGHVFVPPDPKPGMSVQDVRDENKRAKREWVSSLMNRRKT